MRQKRGGGHSFYDGYYGSFIFAFFTCQLKTNFHIFRGYTAQGNPSLMHPCVKKQPHMLHSVEAELPNDVFLLFPLNANH